MVLNGHRCFRQSRTKSINTAKAAVPLLVMAVEEAAANEGVEPKGGVISPADGWLLAAMGFAAVGYVAGAKLSQQMPAEQVICWILVASAPLTIPATVLLWPQQLASTSAWVGFAYVTVFSMWLGFFAWYRGLALGGTVRVSQVQLLQPFLGILFSVPILGEHLDAVTVLFAAAVMGVVLVGRKMPAHRK